MSFNLNNIGLSINFYGVRGIRTPDLPTVQSFDNGLPTNAPCIVSFTNNFTFKYFNCHTQDHMPNYQAPFRSIQVTCQAIKRQRHKWTSPQRDVCAQRDVLRTLMLKGT